jgi:hypothetical protein
MKQIHKEYTRPFLLEKTKLDRLLTVIHGRLAEHQHTALRDDFEVFLTGQRREEMTGVDDVLGLDNSRKSKIQRLLITACASAAGAARPAHEIHVDFDARATAKPKVTISVRSDNAGWSDRALSEVEEQVERTSLQDVPHRIALGILALSVSVALLIILLSSLIELNGAYGDPSTLWLRQRDAGRIEEILKQQRTITDEEMREISTRQLRNVFVSDGPNPPSKWTRPKAFIGVPLVAILACAVYLFGKCYPSAIFLWGDEIERYNKMLQTRRIVWGIVIGVCLVGVLSKLLYSGLFPAQ